MRDKPELSLMVINLLASVFMDEHFQPRESADPDDYDRILQIAEDAGYCAVDITDMENDLFGTDAVGRMLEKHHLSVGSIIMFENYAADDEKEQERVCAHTFRAIDHAAGLGSHTLMLVCAGAQPGKKKEELRDSIAVNMSRAVRYASDKGVSVCIEDFPSLQIPMCSIEDIRYLLDNVPGLKLVYDTANMLVENDSPAEFFDTLKDRIGYCHLKDVRIAPADYPAGDTMYDGRKMITTYHGKGIIDLKDAVRRLVQAGYNDYMSVEYCADPADEDVLSVVRCEREYLEGLMKEIS
ncbi:MAG: sugar phosphate isomerase/epimerase [Lachnospiraceae bacterium]|nr:sugar phosphate isomerase/epimerase [Lachnospiraceae bacterium]